jgi:hypothetical protein
VNEPELIAARVEDLLEAYRRAAVNHGAAIGTGRHRVANRNSDLLASIARELRSRGQEGEEAIEGLLRDEAIPVRIWAATHALPFSAKAEGVLAEVAAGPPSPFRLIAEVTLKEWKAGRLT